MINCSEIPFYANTSDDSHCFQACLRMVLGYFLPEDKFSWQKLDRITNKPKNKITWPMAGLTWLIENQFSVVQIVDFDYSQFAKYGKDYLKSIGWSSEKLRYQLKTSDIKRAIIDAKFYSMKKNQLIRNPDLDDIKSYLSDDYLIICNVNGKKLHNQRGENGHYVVVKRFTDENILINDPGSPPNENLIVTARDFFEAWQGNDFIAIKRA